MNDEMQSSIEERRQSQKDQLVELLKKTPIVQVACEKTGVGRATFYRWKKEDREFAKVADEALLEGSLLVNDLAESQLMSAIRDKNITAIIFWLKHHHSAYTTRVEVMAHIKQSVEELTPEQEAVVREALRLASSGQDSSDDKNHVQEHTAGTN